MDLELKGKIAVITGGSVGIGLAVAQALAAEGVHLFLCARDGDRLQKRSEEIRANSGIQVAHIEADVSRSEDIQTMLAEIARVYPQGIDILINNAGTGSNETVMDSIDAKWQHYWDLHVMAAVRLARGIVPMLEKRGGGVILHNSSICAKQPLYYEPIYNVTKAALVMFSKCLANELVGRNIRVNCINPGLILTPDWIKTAKQLTQNTSCTWEEHLDQIAKKNTPIGRFATPEELAHFFVFLCSPRSSYCVGSEYFVDGGWLNVVA
jgi:NAD(P)-dependent dehydrogenase (short-subunit alcohol dehydrogenase family)